VALRQRPSLAYTVRRDGDPSRASTPHPSKQPTSDPSGSREPRRSATQATKERQVPRRDGRLSHELDPQRPGPQDKCGVFGVWAPGEDV
jgi:hypothetical protein